MPSDPTTMEFLIRAQAKLDEICEIAEELGLLDKFLMIANVGVVHDHEDKFLIESISKIEADNKEELMTVLNYIADNWTDDDIEDGDDPSSVDFWLKN
jgi:hypothetical protein